jgi:hypothetical protein
MLKKIIIVQAGLVILLSAPVALAAPGDPAAAPPTPTTTPIAPPQPATPQPAQAPATATANYQPGSVVSVYLMEGKDKKDTFMRGQSIGRFYTDANPWNLGLHTTETRLKSYKNQLVGYEVDAYFGAKETGEYSFVADLNFPPANVFGKPEKKAKKNPGWLKCHYQLFIEGNTVIDQSIDAIKDVDNNQQNCGFTKPAVGTVQLKEGLHKIRQWLDCEGGRKIAPTMPIAYPKGCGELEGKPFNTDIFPADEVSVTLKVRHPNEDMPDLLKSGELVYEKKP